MAQTLFTLPNGMFGKVELRLDPGPWALDLYCPPPGPGQGIEELEGLVVGHPNRYPQPDKNILGGSFSITDAQQFEKILWLSQPSNRCSFYMIRDMEENTGKQFRKKCLPNSFCEDQLGPGLCCCSLYWLYWDQRTSIRTRDTPGHPGGVAIPLTPELIQELEKLTPFVKRLFSYGPTNLPKDLVHINSISHLVRPTRVISKLAVRGLSGKNVGFDRD